MRKKCTPLLLVLTVLVLALPLDVASESGAVWRAKLVAVHDYTPEGWQPLVRQTVAAFNKMLPKRGPRLVYHPHAPQPCPSLKERHGSIAVCVDFSKSTAYAYLTVRRRSISKATVTMWNAPRPDGRLLGALCHEFMHAVTDIRDNYRVDGYGAGEYPLPNKSCVWGTLSSPGPFDRAFAKKVYGKYGERERAGKRHGEGRHGKRHRR